jgi:NADH-quinone oxidoreductase subunit F
VTLRELLARAEPGDGVAAVLLGGAAGTFLVPDEFDVPLTFEGTRAIGASLGSGAVMVFGARDDVRDAVARIAAFFRHESCGQCVPCRVGTVRQDEALERLAAGSDERRLLGEIAAAMYDASICGLGQTAGSAVQSAIAKGLVGG